MRVFMNISLDGGWEQFCAFLISLTFFFPEKKMRMANTPCRPPFVCVSVFPMSDMAGKQCLSPHLLLLRAYVYKRSRQTTLRMSVLVLAYVMVRRVVVQPTAGLLAFGRGRGTVVCRQVLCWHEALPPLAGGGGGGEGRGEGRARRGGRVAGRHRRLLLRMRPVPSG